MFKSVNKDAFRDAFRASIPIFIAYVPIELVGGILLNAAGLNLFFIFLMSLLVFGGSAQYIAASMIASGAPVTSIIITTFIINLRHFLMSSNLNMVIKNKSPKYILPFGLGLTDETFAVNYEKYISTNWDDTRAMLVNYLCLAIWLISFCSGSFLGNFISIDTYISGFIITALFTTMIMGAIKNFVYVLVAIISILSFIVLYSITQSSLIMVVAPIIACSSGLIIEKILKVSEEKKGVVVDE